MRDVYGRDLDLNLLRVLVVVAEEGSITRAASRLYITQPAVSAAMHRLVSFVGSELFARQGRGIVLTTRGAELAQVARQHLQSLVAATMAAPVFDPKTSTATVRLGLSDSMEGILLAPLLKLLRSEAPWMTLVVLPVQFRTVEAAILEKRVDFAVSVADKLPRSILRQPLSQGGPRSALSFVCLYDPRFAQLPKRLTEREYFAREHVAVSYAADVRGVVEDELGKVRKVRVSLPSFSGLSDVVEGSPLLATVPYIAQHMLHARPQLRIAPLPFALEGASLDLLWSRVADEDPAGRFVRGLLTRVGRSLATHAASHPRSKPA